MSLSSKKLQYQIEEFILKAKIENKEGKINKEDTINDPMFNYIAKGSKEYKLSMLTKLLNSKPLDIDSSDYDNNYLKIVEQRFSNDPNYLSIVKYNRHKMFKYFGIKNMEELCRFFKINMDIVKKNYDNFIDELNNIPLEIENINSFIENVDNKKRFIKEFNTNLTLFTFCEVLKIEDSIKSKLIQESNKILSDEKEKIEKEKNLKENTEYIKMLKKRKNLTLAKIYPLLHNQYISQILGKDNLSIVDLAKYFKISTNFSKYEVRQEELLKKYCRGKDECIHNMYIKEILNITEAELNQWKKEGVIVPTEKRAFRKWGQTLFSDYFAVDYISFITDEDISSWRIEKQLKKVSLKAKNINKTSEVTEKNKSLKKSIDVIDLIQQAETKGFVYRNNKIYYKCDLNIQNYNIKELVVIKLKKEIHEYQNLNIFLEDLNRNKDLIDINKEEKKFSNKIEKYNLEENTKQKLLKYLSEFTNNIVLRDFLPTTVDRAIKKNLEVFINMQQKQQVIKELKIDQYELGFIAAREIDRKIKLIIGPTNSGKTFEALQHLMTAKSGVYLAPLRLLAMEIYDKLNASGIPCNLITGEERIIIKGATHTASTIEMMDQNNIVEVAIIDEFQMLDNPQRGWAWTSAMVGVPAKNVYIIGNEQKLNVAIDLYKHLNEDYEIIRKDRFNSLKAIPELLPLNELKKGDALIAFSRKDVLAYATLLRKNKYKVSVIYGALSPEVRRKQAELFNSGVTDIVVSTDAIGMGLNLPIKRIIFATLMKFNGEEVDNLSLSEFLQISGRAGRYGLNEEGFVGLLKNKVNDKKTLKTMKLMLSAAIPSSDDSLSVAPINWHIEIISKILKTKNLAKILLYFSNLEYNSIYKPSNLENIISLYEYIKRDISKLSLGEQYHLSTAPVEINNHELIRFYKILLEKIINNENYDFFSNHYYDLESAELENKKLAVFLWLSFYYKNLDTKNIKTERNNLSSFIQKQLVKEKKYSFSRMIEPPEGFDNEYY